MIHMRFVMFSDFSPVGKLCGYGRPTSEYDSHGPELGLGFRSGDWDFENDRIGFKYYYTAFHGGLFLDSHGFFAGSSTAVATNGMLRSCVIVFIGRPLQFVRVSL